MNKSYLDDVVFDKAIKLKRPKKFKDTEVSIDREKKTRRRRNLGSKLLRLVYFFITIAVVCYASMASCSGILSVSAGRHVPFSEFIECFDVIDKD